MLYYSVSQSRSLIGKSIKYENYKSQLAKYKRAELSYIEKIDEQGNRIVEQDQVILSQKDAIDLGLLEIDRLKKVSSQVKVVTELVVDTLVMTHTDTVTVNIDNQVYLKLPQSYTFKDDFLSIKAEVNEMGLNLNNISIYNENTVTIGYKKDGLFKPLVPIIDIKNTNPYMNTTQVSNVVIEPKKDLWTNHKVWGGVGFLIGVFLN